MREETDLRLGIELDYVAGREDRMAALLDGARLGLRRRVGALRPRRGRRPRGTGLGARLGPRRFLRQGLARYFETLAEAARSGLYDIMAHPDLVKVWGSARPQPERDPRYYYEPAVEAMLDAGVAMELSTAGLRKPVGELYPAPALLAMAVDAGVPIALSSDAHVPDQIGFRYDDALAALSDAGVTELCVFERRQRRLEPIG